MVHSQLSKETTEKMETAPKRLIIIYLFKIDDLNVKEHTMIAIFRESTKAHCHKAGQDEKLLHDSMKT